MGGDHVYSRTDLNRIPVPTLGTFKSQLRLAIETVTDVMASHSERRFDLRGVISMLRNLCAFICFAMLSAALVLLSSCSSSNQEERRWTEDVLLEDGSTVQIERYVAFDATSAMGGGAYNAVETKSTLHFTGELASLPAWDFPYAALVLYRSKDTGDWVVVSTTSSCEVWQKHGRPRPGYWQHELRGAQWAPSELSAESIGKKTNLFYSYWGDDVPKRIGAEFTRSRQSDPRIVKRYREIDSDPHTNCM